MSDSIEVVHGNPDETELAIVVSLVAAASSVAPAVPAEESATSNWARPAMRTTLPTGPGAWWRSGLPRP